MNLNTLSMTKLVIRLIIFTMLLVMLFIISLFLFSARYWPDVYNYINANITIKSVPDLYEIRIGDSEIDYTTEIEYPTTDVAYNDLSTSEDSFVTEGYEIFTTSDNEYAFEKNFVKREVKIEDVKDYRELPPKSVIIDYFFDEETSTKLIKDLIDESKLSTKYSRDVEMITEMNDEAKSIGKTSEQIIVVDRCHGNGTNEPPPNAIFPWVAAIFIKNETESDQLSYYCDGAVLNNKTILTAARCVISNNQTVEPVNVVVILGKTSLKALGDNEVVYRIKQIKVHENFTNENGTVVNDLALLITEDTIDVTKDARAACLSDERSGNEAKESVTTAWKISGDLTIINLDNKRNCSDPAQLNTFCVTYGDDVPLCPSYGGIYATRDPNDSWYLQGVFYGDPTVRDICINKTVSYTDLSQYHDWIKNMFNKLNE